MKIDRNFVRRRGTLLTPDCCLLDSSGETVMKKFTMIGAACLAVVLAAASPALAQGGNRGFHNGGAHFAGGGYRGGGFRGGVGPGIAAGLIAGAVVGGVVSSGYGPGYGPRYYDDSYAYDNGYDSTPYNNGYNGAYDNGYAVRNGFVCQPGTVFRGEDGRPHLCQ
jgi:hypothetical protein